MNPSYVILLHFPPKRIREFKDSSEQRRSSRALKFERNNANFFRIIMDKIIGK
jgi:hypothetical protein